MTGQWSWVIVGTGAGAAAGIVARTCGYLLREHMRARAMTRMARALSGRGGRAEVSDQDGTAWNVCLGPGEPQ